MEDLNSTQVFKLEIENELRILVGEQQCCIELTNGFAEIFGTEMEISKPYTFSPRSSVSIFTWQGCTVQVTGRIEPSVIDNDTFIILNTVLHASLEERRIKAEAENTRGPITLVVGPKDSGKTSLCRFLLNYASRLGRRPIFVDLDVGQNSISVPGSVGILNVEKPADIVQGFEARTAQVFQFGFKSPGHNIALYFLLLRQLGRVVKSGLRQARNNVKPSGVIINSCGWVRGLGYDAITCAAMSFEIDFLCVLGEERLYTQLKRDMPSSVQVLYIPKMKGVVERDIELRSRTRDQRIREYFYGPTDQLRPHSFEVVFSEITVYKVASETIPSDFDSASVTLDNISLQPVSLSLRLVNQILGISSGNGSTEDILFSGVFGFVCVRHVDVARNVITVLSPEPGPLPSSILLLGEMRMTEFLS